MSNSGRRACTTWCVCACVIQHGFYWTGPRCFTPSTGHEADDHGLQAVSNAKQHTRAEPRPGCLHGAAQVCTDSFVPEFWMLKYPTPSAPTVGVAWAGCCGLSSMLPGLLPGNPPRVNSLATCIHLPISTAAICLAAATDGLAAPCPRLTARRAPPNHHAPTRTPCCRPTASWALWRAAGPPPCPR